MQIFFCISPYFHMADIEVQFLETWETATSQWVLAVCYIQCCYDRRWAETDPYAGWDPITSGVKLIHTWLLCFILFIFSFLTLCAFIIRKGSRGLIIHEAHTQLSQLLEHPVVLYLTFFLIAETHILSECLSSLWCVYIFTYHWRSDSIFCLVKPLLKKTVRLYLCVYEI